MPQYLSPGVYVEEVPSGNAPIAGVGTSTAGFVGVVAYSEVSTDPAVLLGRVLAEDITPVETFPTGTVVTDENFASIREGVGADNKVRVSGPLAAVQTHLIGMTLQEEIVTDDGEIFPVDTEVDTTNFDAISQAIGSGKVKVTGPLAPVQTHLVGMTLLEEVTWTGETITSGTEIATAELAKAIADAVDPEQRIRLEPATPANVAALCTNFTQFLNAFGGFSSDNAMQNNLAHAVYGFFNNGGTRCWITRVEMGDGANEAEVVQATNGNLIAALDTFKPIDEIALVAIPGATDSGVQEAIMSHCENAGDRFAIIDGQRTNAFTPEAIQGGLRDSNYAALYFPWITVYDPASNGTADVPPSGHLAGIYARVDTLRGVHKAPANEVIRGALGVEFRLSKAQHDGLNPDGINVIRQFNGNVTVWGARTLGGDDNTEWKYINVRRLFLFLRESIDEGTQWVVFEPNTPDLWAKITRNVSAFLTNVWRDGALFGATPQEAFYVKCDAETNPPEVRDLGQVVTEIGVAPVKPAEFVIFRISQWAGPAGG